MVKTELLEIKGRGDKPPVTVPRKIGETIEDWMEIMTPRGVLHALNVFSERWVRERALAHLRGGATPEEVEQMFVSGTLKPPGDIPRTVGQTIFDMYAEAGEVDQDEFADLMREHLEAKAKGETTPPTQ